ncbi:hypothetical protein [Gimesia algae]|uniref:hypothetical protein n=1 Tax=Gimesia algae TaxID=2527971 RepID=UPI0018D72ADD|nr:hypothetical protein [Gimesia algae]
MTTFRIGKVRRDLREKIWFLAYYENGKRLRPQIGQEEEGKVMFQVDGRYCST